MKAIKMVTGLVGWLALGVFSLTSGLAAPDQDAPQTRPELALGRTAEYDYDPPEPGSYELAVLKAASAATRPW